MTIVILHPNQIVYVINGFEIFEATVVKVENINQIILISECTSYKERQKTYGVDFFITENKANKILKDKLEKHKTFNNKRNIEIEKNNEDTKVEEKRAEEVSLKQRKLICSACGLPVGVFGHCGCSH